ncbi:MAG: hypothetical protein K6F30_09700 [Lachnospiraceae bacterium]|nr:hypothetical protein [Lachnospiraceae bacterium]
MRNQNAIMAVVNQDYLGPLKTMWTSLFSSNPYPIDFYLFFEDLTEDDISNLQVFISQWDNKTFIPMVMTSEILEGLPVTKEFPKEIYFKLLGLDILPNDLHQVLCMDLDMIVQKDISEVFQLPISSSGIAACPDIFGHYFGLEDNNLDCLGLDHNRPYFNAGFMLFSLDFIQKIGGGKAIISLAHMHKDKLYYPEQDILNILFHDSYIQLPWEAFNCPPLYYIMNQKEVEKGIHMPLPLKEISAGNIPDGYFDYTNSMFETTSVIHYMGGTKPWKSNREPSPVYDIFDQAYTRTCENKALKNSSFES